MPHELARKWLVLATFSFDSRTTRVSKGIVTHPSYTYEGRLLRAGYLDKSIPVPSGLYQGSDVVVEIAESDRALREFLCTETPLRRLFTLRLMPENASEAAYEPFGVNEIKDVEFVAGKCIVTGRDITWSWIDKPLPGLGTRTNFPWMQDGIDDVFIPIIQGINISESILSPPIGQGVIQLPYMGATIAGSPPISVIRYGLCQTPITSITVFKKLPGDELYSIADESEYTITNEEHTINGIAYSIQFLDFYDVSPANAPEGTEVRVDAHGINYRGPWGPDAHGTIMPEVNGMITSPPQAIRNPVDFLINILFALLSNEPRLTRYNVASFQSVRNELETIISGGYKCDGAITEPITAREFLGRFLTSFELDLFVNRIGELTLSITTESDPDRPVFSDGPIFGEPTDNSLILMNSVRERVVNPHVNRLRYNFAKNYATGHWGTKLVHNNEADQLALGGSQSPPTPHVVEDTLEMWFVRETDTAEHVIGRRMEYLGLSSSRIELKGPLPEVFDDVELAGMMGVTHHGGLAPGGHSNSEFKITGITYEFDSFIATLRGIIRSPGADLVVVLEMMESGVSSFGDVTYVRSETAIDPRLYDGTVRTYFQVVALNGAGVASPVYLVDSQGNIKATVIIPALASPDTIFDTPPGVQFTLNENPDLYYVRVPGGTLTIRTARIVIKQTNATRTELVYPLATTNVVNGTQTSNAYHVSFGILTFNQNAVADDNVNHGIFLKEAGVYADLDGATPWTYEVIHRNLGFNVGQTSIHALFNRNTATQVSGVQVELPASGGSIYRQFIRFADTTTGFTDGQQFETQGRATTSAGFNYSVEAYRCWLKVRLKNLTKARIDYRVAKDGTIGPTGISGPIQQVLTPISSLNPEVYFEAVGKEETAGNSQIVLGTSGNNDYATFANTSEVSDSALNFNGLTKTRLRSDQIVIPSGNRFVVKGKGSTGTTRHVQAFAILKVSRTGSNASPTLTTAYRLIGSVSAGSSNNNNVTTAAINTSFANHIIIVAASGATPTITDSWGNTYTLRSGPYTGSFVNTRIYECVNPVVNRDHTFTISDTGGAPSIAVAAFERGTASNPFDQQNGASTASASSLQTGAITPTENGELIVCGLGYGGTAAVSIDQSFTILQQFVVVSFQHFGIALAYKIQGAAAAAQPTWQLGSTTYGATAIASFKKG